MDDWWVGLEIVTHDRCEEESQWYGIFQVSGGSEEDMVISHDHILL